MIYKNFDKSDADSACRTCPLRTGKYCMDLDMHKAKVVNVYIKEE